TAPAPASNSLGLVGRDLTSAQRKQLGLGDDEGVLLAEVSSDTAREAGLRVGDVIVAVGRDNVASAAALNRKLSAAKAGETLMLLMQRGGTTQFIAVGVPKRRGRAARL